MSKDLVNRAVNEMSTEAEAKKVADMKAMIKTVDDCIAISQEAVAAEEEALKTVTKALDRQKRLMDVAVRAKAKLLEDGDIEACDKALKEGSLALVQEVLNDTKR